MATLKDATEDNKRRLEFLEEKLDRFLDYSDFEKVDGLNKILNL
jgi:hypothetical protein